MTQPNIFAEKLAQIDPKHLEDFKGSAIDDSIIALNFESLDEEGAAEALLYKPERRNDGRVTDKFTKYQNIGSGWWCSGGIDLSTFEPMADWGCLKPDEPRLDKDGKPIKYEHPPSVPTEYFALKVPFSVGLEIAKRYELGNEYTQRRRDSDGNDEDTGFWSWAIGQKTIPVMITEGAKKVACLLSHGYLSIGLPGIWMGCLKETDILKPGIAAAVKDREVVIVFDSDSKEKTQKAVNGAAVKLDKACQTAQTEKVTQATWAPHLGKGVDDLIVKKGIEMFDDLMEDRQEVQELPKTGLQDTNEGNPCPVCRDTSGACSTGLSRTKNKAKVEDGALCAKVLTEDDLPDGWAFSEAKSGRISDKEGVQRGKLYPLDSKPSENSGEPVEAEKKEKKTAADQLMEAALKANYFHAADHTAYADIEIEGNRHTYPVRSASFRRWLSGEFYDRTDGKVLGSQTMADGLNMLEMMGSRGELREVSLRTAEYEGKTYVDLGSDDWTAVEIDTNGWRIIPAPPVRFWRPSSMLPLPVPIEGGSLSELRELINVDDSSWALMITFVLFCYRPRMKYPILEISAHRGSGKTAAAEILKGLIDPGKGGLMKLPSKTETLGVALSGRWLAVYDNVGFITPDQSDDLCRVATNFTHSARKLFTDAEENIVEVVRPQIITAIDAIVTRDDLADRALKVVLPEVTPDRRLSQHELDAKIEAAKPSILGALFTTLSRTLAELEVMAKPIELPRMADYGLFAIAASKHLGLDPGQFMEIFNESREESRRTVIESSPLAEAVVKFMEKYPLPKSWTGTASELLKELSDQTDDSIVRSKYWPKASNALMRQLNRLAPDLKEEGIEVSEYKTGNARTRNIRLEKAVKVSSVSSAKDYRKPEALLCKGLDADDIADGIADDTSIADGIADDTSIADDMRTIKKSDIVRIGIPSEKSFQLPADDTDDTFPLLSKSSSEVIHDEV
jgi:hypothetical protein